VDHLVEVLGSFQLRSLLIPEAVRGLFFPSMDSCWRDCWEHSVLTAQLSREIAKAIEYPFPEEAYIGGLLHDLGVFILMSQNPEKYREVAEEATSSRCDLETIEESRFGISHTKIGGVHAEKWTFPKVITLAIKNHHKSDDIDTKPLVRIVAVASNMAQKAGYGIQSALPDESRLDLNLNQLNLERRKLDNIVENIDWRTLKRSKTDESKETSPGIIAGAT
jgi:putative nucleotidyltransferase with HDIG domain